MPDDLVAAPAYAQVGAIIALAATAGIQKMVVDSHENYAILIGQGFQVDFRSHPTLGVVGAYSRYNGMSKGSNSLVLEDLRSAIRYGRGIIDTELTIFMDLSTNFTRQQSIERWKTASEWFATERGPETSGIFCLKLATISEVYLPLIAGLFAPTPKRVPALFPTTTMRADFSLTALALNGKYWAATRLDSFDQSYILKWPESQVTPSWQRFHWSHSKFAGRSPEVQNLFDKLNPSDGIRTRLLGMEWDRSLRQQSEDPLRLEESQAQEAFKIKIEEHIKKIEERIRKR